MGQYKVLTGEFADLMLGYYGETIGPKDPAVLEKARAHAKKEPITCRPADLLKPEWEALRADAMALKGCNGTDEDVLTFAMFPQVAPKFFGTREQGAKNLGKDPSKAAPAAAAPQAGAAAAQPTGPVKYAVTINGQTHNVTVASGTVEREDWYGNEYSSTVEMKTMEERIAALREKRATVQSGGGEKRVRNSTSRAN